MNTSKTATITLQLHPIPCPKPTGYPMINSVRHADLTETTVVDSVILLVVNRTGPRTAFAKWSHTDIYTFFAPFQYVISAHFS